MGLLHPETTQTASLTLELIHHAAQRLSAAEGKGNIKVQTGFRKHRQKGAGAGPAEGLTLQSQAGQLH